MTYKLMLNFIYFIILTFLLSSCSDIGGIVEIAVKDGINNSDNNSVAPLISLKEIDSDFKTEDTLQNIETLLPTISNPKYKIGDPYEIKNIWYYPKRDLSYEETGIASWYGEKFHGKLTANGEIFNKNTISAAHKTLPMPSMVRVTNLDNGNVLNVRINDRGPYVHGRIIDLSEKAADLLGFKDVGIARVKVNILVEKSLWLERSAKDGKFPGANDFENSIEKLPEINSASRPKVSIVNTISNNDVIENIDEKEVTSFTQILASSRQGNLRKVSPQETNIWVQVGAFASSGNANKVILKIAHIYDTNISSVEFKGRILQRVRLGPTQEIKKADEILEKVFKLGFKGSKIVVE